MFRKRDPKLSTAVYALADEIKLHLQQLRMDRERASYSTYAGIHNVWLEQEKDAEVVFSQHLVGENPVEMSQEFAFMQEMNSNCRKNTLSFVLSPTVEDGKALEQKRLREICEQIMKDMKFRRTPGDSLCTQGQRA